MCPGKNNLASPFTTTKQVIGQHTLPKMALSKKEKDTECRIFQEKWTENYLFTEANAKPVCLVCNQQVAVFKEFNIRRHNETHHKDKYDHLKGQIREDEINKLVASLKNSSQLLRAAVISLMGL